MVHTEHYKQHNAALETERQAAHCSLGEFIRRLSMQHNTAVIVGCSWSLGRKAEVLLVPLGLLANWKLG